MTGVTNRILARVPSRPPPPLNQATCSTIGCLVVPKVDHSYQFHETPLVRFVFLLHYRSYPKNIGQQEYPFSGGGVDFNRNQQLHIHTYTKHHNSESLVLITPEGTHE